MSELTPEIRDVLEVVRAAACLPMAATAGDEQKRDAILSRRLMDLKAFLDSVLHPDQTDLAWSVAYLRERLAENPAEGRYKTWAEAVAERRADQGGDA